MAAKRGVRKRPTETASGLGLAAAVYGFLTQTGVPEWAAGVLAVLVAFAPALVSEIVDALRADRAPDAATLESGRR